MTTVGEVLRDPHLAGLVTRLAPGGEVSGVPVTGVSIAEDVAGIAGAGAGTVVILTARASADLTGYRLDVALRVAAEHAVAAVVLLTAEPPVIEPSASAIAVSGPVVVLHADARTSPAELVVAVDRRLTTGAAAALERAHHGLTRLCGLLAEGASLDDLLAAAGTIAGPVAYRPPGPGELTAPVLVDGREEGALSAARTGDRADDMAQELVLALCAAAVGEVVRRTRRAEEAPEQRRAELLTELLSAERAGAERLLDRARALGIDIDGWHTALLLDTGDPGADDLRESARFDRATEVRRVALEVARDAGGVWQRARSGAAQLFVRIDPTDPGLGAVPAVTAVAREIVAGAADLGIPARAGVGSAHPGPEGMRRSVAEARGALAAREDPVVAFDSLGTNRFLAEWSASASGRDISRTLLAPLDRLDPERCATAVRTLAAYLDHHGSLLHAAEALHLHRNSLSYRIQRILAMLDVDLDDPDQWMMLQLACRIRLLQEGRTRS
ncbi:MULTISPECIES: PucR family transcriptional regulator [Amycolatopsis]|uniref:PucR family transcriptional regulator n=1 Tax=Amycolatopsis TaxID=1813 RepID=UPI000B8B78FF|nr:MULTISPECIES: helix-turn-helix domain-containing protein [Amycolatopsis]OXM75244.1 hypothetical protein CF166_01310 [Amycolatopsis sp. KNN50.9b]